MKRVLPVGRGGFPQHDPPALPGMTTAPPAPPMLPSDMAWPGDSGSAGRPVQPGGSLPGKGNAGVLGELAPRTPASGLHRAGVTPPHGCYSADAKASQAKLASQWLDMNSLRDDRTQACREQGLQRRVQGADGFDVTACHQGPPDADDLAGAREVQSVEVGQVAVGLIRDGGFGENAVIGGKPRQEGIEPFGKIVTLQHPGHEVGFAEACGQEVLAAHFPFSRPAGVVPEPAQAVPSARAMASSHGRPWP